MKVYIDEWFVDDLTIFDETPVKKWLKSKCTYCNSERIEYKYCTTHDNLLSTCFNCNIKQDIGIEKTVFSTDQGE